MPLQSTFGWNKSSSLLSQIKFLSNGWESWFSFEPMRKFLDLNVNNRRVLRKWPSVSSVHIIWSAGRKDETKSAFWLVMRMISLNLPYSPRRYIPPRPAGNDLVLVIPVCMLGALLPLSKFKQELSCFYFYFCFFFRFGFIFLYGLVSSSYENINSFSPSVINSVNLVNILGLQNTKWTTGCCLSPKGWGKVRGYRLWRLNFPWSLSWGSVKFL